MSIASSPSTAPFEIPPLPVRRFSVDEFHRLISADVLGEDDAVELLEGWIVPKMPHLPRHDATVDLARESLSARLPAGWRVRVQSAITTSDSEPEPDLAVVRGPASRYARSHPGRGDIALVIEVADSSLSRDREFKGRLYARARIPFYWIINLVDSLIEVYAEPAGRGNSTAYREHVDFAFTQSIPLSIADHKLDPVPAAELQV